MRNYCEEHVNNVFIILNNFNTLENNIKVVELGTKKPSSLKYEKIEAFGSDGHKKLSEDAYRGFERVSRLFVSDTHSYDMLMREIYIGKDVKVYYSDDKGRFRYGTISEIEDSVVFQDNREIEITIDLQPFKYESNINITIDGKSELYNMGNVYTLPVIKAYGTGRGKIYINEQIMDIELEDEIIIDSEKIDIFDRQGLRANSNRKSGNFFRIREEVNNIDFDGDITGLDIKLNWRWR